GFILLPNNTWKGAGIAIPVFSLRSKSSFGVGEFNDLRLLADWAKQAGLKLIQILPVNDTIATKTWVDSYPYAAISAFALHPIYINLAAVSGKKYGDKLTPLKKKQAVLNELSCIDYEEVLMLKMPSLRELFELLGTECFESGDYKEFFESNRHWLVPYAAFSYFRDKHGSSHFDEWKTNNIYNKEEIEELIAPGSAAL